MRDTSGLVAALAAHGIDTAFTAVDGSVPAGLRCVVLPDVVAAAAAAQAYAQVSRVPGVLMIEPGGLAAAPAVAGRVLVVSVGASATECAAIGRAVLDSGGVDGGGVDGGGARTRQAGDPAEAAAQLSAAMAALRDAAAGPAHVGLAPGALAGAWPAPAPPVGPPPAPDAAVGSAAELLAGAQRPLIVAGVGAGAAEGPITHLAEEIGAPVTTTVAGKGAVDEGHPLALGASAGLAAVGAEVGASDVVLVVGPDAPAGPSAARIRTAELGGDVAETVRALSDALPTRHTRLGVARAAALRAQCRAEARAAGGRFEELADALREALPADSVLVGDESPAVDRGAVPFFPVAGPRRFCRSAAAVAALHGVAAARPDVAVAALVDAAGLLAGARELVAAARLGRPLPIVAVDGRADGPDLALFAAACGAAGVRAVSPDEVEDLVTDALELDRPTVVHLDWVG